MLGQWPDAWTHLVLLQVWPWQQEHIFFHGKTCESSDFFFEALVLKERVMIARAKHWRWGRFSWSSLVCRRNFLLQYICFFLPHYQYHLLPPLPATPEEGEHHHRRKGGSTGEGRGTSSTPGAKMGRDTKVETLGEACGAVCGGRGR